MRYLFPVFLSVLLVSISAWAGTWRDDFNDGDLSGWKMIKMSRNFFLWEGNWRIKDGVVIGGDENPDVIYFLSLSRGATWSDYIAEVSVKLSKPLEACSPWSGVYLLISTGEFAGWNGYGLSIRRLEVPVVARGVSIIGNVHPINATPFKTEADRWYRLRIDVKRGGKIRCFIDDEPVSPWFQGIQKGAPGFGTEGVVAMFDDFVVTGPDIPDGGPGAKAVRPRDKLATTWAKVKSSME